ncbi:hypothetical protein BD779DRAFT_1452646 [Infundibulicybe gibba]|nr:hypothetical protein BD779DRAFT_1452646 [Infundibulicybe gibba]
MASTLQLSVSEHPIKSVTVFKSSKAEVVRVFNSLSLQQGRNKVEIKGLSSSIDSQSIRVSGLGDGRLLDVVCTVEAPLSEDYAPSTSAERLRTLKVKKDVLESEKRVREHEADLLVNYAKTLSGEHVTPMQMTQFLASFVEQGQKNVEAVRAIGEKIVEVDRLIAAEKSGVASKKGLAHGQVTIVIASETKANIDLKLTYIVGNAQWRSAYELHATTENGKPSSTVSLHYLARITQSTGEDWIDTALTLSTVNPDTSAKFIPKLYPVKITPRLNGGLFGPSKPATGGLFGEPQQQRQQQQPQVVAFGQVNPGFQQQQQQPGAFGFGAANQSLVPGASLFGAASRGPAPAASLFGSAAGPSAPAATGGSAFGAQQVEEEGFEEVTTPGLEADAEPEPKTIVTETPVAISYSVHGASTIPSDGVEHQATVAILQFESTISHITVPRADPRVYLQCNVKNTSEYRLLPGFVSVILDDSYVSKTSIQAVNTGDSFDCTLGDDASIQVTYSRISRVARAAGGAFAELINTTTYTTRISIHNKHQFAISDLRVRDVIPTCEDKRIRVVLTTPESLANAKEEEEVELKDGLIVKWHNEKEGKPEWRWKVGSGEKVTIEAKWEVRAPANITWVDQVVTGDL